jgi:hypothetical protein
VHHPLVEERALLDAVLVLDLPGADLEAPLAELVEPAHALDRAVARPVLLLELVDPVERGAGDRQPGAQLLALLLVAVLDDAEAADQPRQRQPLADHGHEDQRERDELDQLAAGQRVAGVGRSGSASAAASETAPRIPAQPPTTPRASRRAARPATGRRSIARISIVIEKFQRKRTAITAAQTAAA